jgi:PPOX class probable F420-dependent enzyme
VDDATPTGVIQEVSSRLESDRYGWLTTVAKSGQPVPRLVGFVFDGKELTVYSRPNAAKVGHIKANSRVSLNLDSDGSGRGIVVGGEARVDAVDSDPLEDEQYQAKYGEYAKSMGMTEEFLASFNTRLRISIDKVWTTPPAE